MKLKTHSRSRVQHTSRQNDLLHFIIMKQRYTSFACESRVHVVANVALMKTYSSAGAGRPEWRCGYFYIFQCCSKSSFDCCDIWRILWAATVIDNRADSETIILQRNHVTTICYHFPLHHASECRALEASINSAKFMSICALFQQYKSCPVTSCASSLHIHKNKRPLLQLLSLATYESMSLTVDNHLGGFEIHAQRLVNLWPITENAAPIPTSYNKQLSMQESGDFVVERQQTVMRMN